MPQKRNDDKIRRPKWLSYRKRNVGCSVCQFEHTQSGVKSRERFAALRSRWFFKSGTRISGLQIYFDRPWRPSLWSTFQVLKCQIFMLSRRLSISIMTQQQGCQLVRRLIHIIRVKFPLEYTDTGEVSLKYTKNVIVSSGREVRLPDRRWNTIVF